MHVGGEAVADIAQLGQDLCGADLAGPRQRHDELAVRRLSHRVLDARGDLRNLFDQGSQGRGERQHERALGIDFEFSGVAGRRGAQAFQQGRWGAPAAVAVLRQEHGQALFAAACSARGRWIALHERQRDGRVDLSKARVRIAVIGAGTFGQRHLSYLQREPACEVVAIADPMPAAAELATAQGYRHFGDYRAMLDAVRPEGAIIASPNALHAPMGLACAERGVHILVEKPIAETLAAGQSLADAAERAGVALLVGHHRRYNPVIEKAREIVRGGGIGRLTVVVALWLIRKPDSYFDAAWRREPGGGPVLINLIHDIDDLRFICGEIASVQAVTSSAIRGFAVEDTAAITLRFANGALGTATLSDTVPAPWSWEMTSGEAAQYPQRPENCYLFSGTEGSLTVPKLDLWRYDGEKSWTRPLVRQTLDVPAEDPLARQLRHFCRVIRGEETPRITGPDAVRTLAATLAVHDAARSGDTVVLATPGEAP